MKILLSWSSGKDSAWALHVLQRTHPGAVAALLTTMNESANRVAMHAVRREVLEAQAAACGLPLRIVPIPHPCPNEIYEARMATAVTQALADGFTHMAFGDLFLEDVRRYREEALRGTGLDAAFPLWGRDTRALAAEMQASGVRATVTCVDPRQAPASLAGRAWDATLVAELPPEVDPCGERGEFHTLATDAPAFPRPVAVVPGEVVERDGFVFADLRTAAPAAT